MPQRKDRSLVVGLVLVVCLFRGGLAGAAGPARLVHDFFPGELEGSLPVYQLTQAGPTLFFVAEDLESGLAVWRTDGTVSERVPIPPTPEIPFGVNFVSIVGRLGERVLWKVLPEAAKGTGVLLSATGQGDGVILHTYRSENPQVQISGTVGEQFFFRDCPDAGCAIWSTDGTVGGTRPVAALALYQDAKIAGTFADRWLIFRSRGRLLAYDVAKDRVLLLLREGAHRVEVFPAGETLFLLTWHDRSKLWASRLKAPRAVPLFSSTYIGVAGWRGGLLYFAPDNGRLWSTAGTRATTRPYSGLRADPYTIMADELGAIGTTTFLPMPGYYWGGLLTVDETRRDVKEILHVCTGKYPCLSNRMSKVTIAADRAFEVINQGLWQSDGTPQGTKGHDVLAGANPYSLTVLDGRLLLGATSRDGEGQLWETDGTVSGTRSLTDGTLDRPFQVQGPPLPFAGALFVAANRQGAGPQLWRVADGRATDVSGLQHMASGIYPFSAVSVGGRIVLNGGGGPGWKGIAADGSVEELPVRFEACSISDIICPRRRVLVGERLLFSPYPGSQVWSSDGTAAGTGRLLQIPELAALGRWQDRALVLDQLGGLWITDGSDSGTRFVTEIPGFGDVVAQPVESPVAVGPLTYFFRRVLTRDPVYGTLELWRTDGTAEGTLRLTAISIYRESIPFVNPVEVGGRLFFQCFGVLYTSDGTAAGTYPLPRQPPGETFALVAGTNILYVAAFYFESGSPSLWAINPKALDARLLGTFHSLNGYPPGIPPGSVLGDTLLFHVTDESGLSRLWVTEGTPSSTHPVPGNLVTDRAAGFVTVGDRRYFTGCEAEHGCELWSTDRLGKDTRLVQDIWPGPRGSDPETLSVSGSTSILFAATEPAVGRELWELDLSAVAALGLPF
jgi:ELWxxDGT repeat protein